MEFHWKIRTQPHRELLYCGEKPNTCLQLLHERDPASGDSDGVWGVRVTQGGFGLMLVPFRRLALLRPMVHHYPCHA